jgi:cytochrome P450
MIDPPEHTRWRQLLGGYFSPGRVKRMLDDQHRLAAEIIEGVRSAGECDFVRDVALPFPSTIFLRIMGMPAEQLSEFLGWADTILHTSDEPDPDHTVRLGGMQTVMDYFVGLIAERRANPDPDADDIVTAATTWTIDGAPADDSDVLNCLQLLFMAGLDTVASQSSNPACHRATRSSSTVHDASTASTSTFTTLRSGPRPSPHPRSRHAVTDHTLLP